MGFLKVNSVFDSNLMPEKDDYCVYSLMDKDKKVIYVGQSSNLRQRIFNHLSSDKDFDFIEWCVCKQEDVNNNEADGIVKAKTTMNKVLPKNDLYMVVGGMQRYMASEIKSAMDYFDFAFVSHKGSKYISKKEHDKVMDLFFEFVTELSALAKVRGDNNG